MKAAILDALDKFVRQRPGLDFRNYGDVRTYQAEARRIARDKREYETLAAWVSRHDVTAEDILSEGCRAYSGRLQLVRDTFAPKKSRARVMPSLRRARRCTRRRQLP